MLRARHRQALTLHGQGEPAKAEALYRDILGHMPESFHALHMLGVLLAQRGEWEPSAALIERAIGIDPTVAAALCACVASARRSRSSRGAATAWLAATSTSAATFDANFNTDDLPMLMTLAGLPQRHRRHCLGSDGAGRRSSTSLARAS